MWFLLEAFSVFIARGFHMERTFFLRFEFSLFIFPQVLFVMSYAYFVYRKYLNGKKLIYYVIILVMLLSIGHNVLRLNEWRGGWGGYFLGYDTARQYVDDNSNDAILLLPIDHSSPTYFSPMSRNTQAMVADLTNSSVVRSHGTNYSTVYIASRQRLFFDDLKIINIINLTIADTSPYGRFKRIINRYYSNEIYLYNYDSKN